MARGFINTPWLRVKKLMFHINVCACACVCMCMRVLIQSHSWHYQQLAVTPTSITQRTTHCPVNRKENAQCAPIKRHHTSSSPPPSSSSSSSCSRRVRRVSCSLILEMKLVPPSLLRSSYVPLSFWSILQCLFWYSICVHPLYVL